MGIIRPAHVLVYRDDARGPNMVRLEDVGRHDARPSCNFLDALNDAVVIAESALSATAVSSLMSLTAGRPRPFLLSQRRG
jgi:hypothetical protein